MKATTSAFPKYSDFRKDAIAIAILCSTILAYLFVHMGWGLESVFGNLGDARLNNYFLEHGWQYLLGNHKEFWSPPFFYPEKNVLTYSDNFIGTLPIYALFRLLGMDIETSFQFWVLAVILLNALSAYTALRMFGFWEIPSFVGAMFYSISAPVMIHLDHIQLVPSFFVPWIFYCIYQFFTVFRIRYLYLLGILSALQFYAGIYMGFFAIVGILLFVLAIVGLKFRTIPWDRFRSWNYLPHFLGSAVLFLLLAGVLFYPYIEFKMSSSGRPWFEISAMLPRIQSWFYTDGHFVQFFNRVGKGLPMAHEHRMFLGVVPLFIVAFYGVSFCLDRYRSISMWEKNPQAVPRNLLLLCLVWLGLLFVFTGTDGKYSLYYYTIYRLPGMDAIRAVARIVLVALFPVAIVLAYFFHEMLASAKTNPRRYWTLGVLFCVLVGEQYRGEGKIPTYSKVLAQERIQNLRVQVGELSDWDAFDYQYNLDSVSYVHDLDAMYLGLLLNKPTINGYSGNVPNGYVPWSFSGSREIWFNEKSAELAGKRILQFGIRPPRIIGVESHAKPKPRTENTTALPSFENHLEIAYRDKISDSHVALGLRVKNTSPHKWGSLHRGVYGIAISYAVDANRDKPAIAYQNRILLPHDLEPNEEVVMELILEKPQGDVHITMVQEMIEWFHNREGRVLVVPMEEKKQN